MNINDSKRLSRENAEELAIQVLGFIGRDPEHLGRFLSLSGIGPAQLREAASEPGFLLGVLEFVMADETLLLAFTSNSGVRPTMIAAAHYALSGYDAGPAHG